MLNRTAALCAGVMLLCAYSHAAWADDPQVERAKEMLRRTQEALRQAQAQNAELAKSKSDAEQKANAAVADAAKQVESLKKASQRGANAQLKSAQSAQADLAQKLDAVTTQLTQMTEKQRVTAQILANRDAALTETKQLLAKSEAATQSCEDKNDKLYTYGAEMLQQYQNKGVLSALAQKEPVLGLKQVQIENVVQEYKLKMASEKISK